LRSCHSHLRPQDGQDKRSAVQWPISEPSSFFAREWGLLYVLSEVISFLKKEVTSDVRSGVSVLDRYEDGNGSSGARWPPALDPARPVQQAADGLWPARSTKHDCNRTRDCVASCCRPVHVRSRTCAAGAGACRPGPSSWLSPSWARVFQARDASSRLRRTSVCRFLHDATTALGRVDCRCSMDAMGAAASRGSTVGEPGACCWMWWGLGRGPFLYTFSRAWWPWDRFFLHNHYWSGRFPRATAPPAPPRHLLHSPDCRASVDTDSVCWLLFPRHRPRPIAAAH